MCLVLLSYDIYFYFLYLCFSVSIDISIGLAGAASTTHIQVGYSIADVVAKAELGVLSRANASGKSADVERGLKSEEIHKSEVEELVQILHISEVPPRPRSFEIVNFLNPQFPKS